MIEELGFRPAFDATGVIRDFARTEGGLSLAPSPRVASILERLAGVPR